MKGAKLREKFPDRVPIIFVCHKDILLERKKYLVISTTTLGELLVLVRRNIKLKRSEAIYPMINNTLAPNTSQLSTLYEQHANPDDEILYIYLTKENTFG